MWRNYVVNSVNMGLSVPTGLCIKGSVSVNFCTILANSSAVATIKQIGWPPRAHSKEGVQKLLKTVAKLIKNYRKGLQNWSVRISLRQKINNSFMGIMSCGKIKEKLLR